MKRVLLIGGPNGAGKTTAAMTLLPHFLSIYEFVNADEISRGLNPLQPEGQAVAAGCIMIERIKHLTQEGKNFAFETTCSGLGHLQHLETCKTLGYKVSLIFLWLPNAEMAIERVGHRVRQGGHAIPADVIRRRYVKGLRHMIHRYMPVADNVVIYDNSRISAPLLAVAEKKAGNKSVVHEPVIWEKMIEVANG